MSTIIDSNIFLILDSCKTHLTQSSSDTKQIFIYANKKCQTLPYIKTYIFFGKTYMYSSMRHKMRTKNANEKAACSLRN